MSSHEFEPACRRMEWLDPFYKAVWEKAFAEAIPISGTFELTPGATLTAVCVTYICRNLKSADMAGN